MPIPEYNTPNLVGSQSPVRSNDWNTYMKQNMEHMRMVNLSKTKLFYAVSAGNSGGTTVANTWQMRPLNFVEGNVAAQLALNTGNGQITLQPGVWDIEVKAVIGNAGNAKIRLFNISAGGTFATGTPQQPGTGEAGNGRLASLSCIRSVSSPTVIRLEQWSTYASSYGMGWPVSVDGLAEIYTTISLQLIDSIYSA